ncbi:hypothetical protein VNO78_03780 [Psophocarpus tetragonolobus]|uniref:Uncharacterized protein n=1 Tax=Psophocarpus tetragonolobus TaxID=3891 RepID=A0AAN9T151_PSOTE
MALNLMNCVVCILGHSLSRLILMSTIYIFRKMIMVHSEILHPSSRCPWLSNVVNNVIMLLKCLMMTVYIQLNKYMHIICANVPDFSCPVSFFEEDLTTYDESKHA